MGFTEYGAARRGDPIRPAGRARPALSLYQSDRNSCRSRGGRYRLYERDVFAFQAASAAGRSWTPSRKGWSWAGWTGLSGEVRYVGRIGVRDADYEPLVIDWRAPAAEPFYRATPSDPMDGRSGVGCRTAAANRVVGIEDDLLDGENR